MNELVSVIVPVYNAEAYIQHCIESIINQTYKNLEIILVDDGSIDKSLELCKQYMKKDDRIKVFSKKNGGQSSARNFGLFRCKGEFITFVDSDDFVAEKYVELMLTNMIKTNSDLSVCGCAKVNNRTLVIDNSIHNTVVINREESYKEMIMNGFFAGYVCNKMYKASLLKLMNKDFFKDCMIEDFEFNSRYLNNCDKICFTRTILYYYYVNNASTTKTFTVNDKVLAGVKAYDSILFQYDKNLIKYSDYVAFHALKYQLNINYRVFILKYKTNYNIINPVLYKRIIKSKIIKLTEKIQIWLLYHFPIVCYSLKYKKRLSKR